MTNKEKFLRSLYAAALRYNAATLEEKSSQACKEACSILAFLENDAALGMMRGGMSAHQANMFIDRLIEKVCSYRIMRPNTKAAERVLDQAVRLECKFYEIYQPAA